MANDSRQLGGFRMETDVVPRKGELVVAVCTEGEGKDNAYIASYPELQSETDVIIARATTECWYDDLNTLFSALELYDIDYLFTREGLTIQARSGMFSGLTITRDKPGDALRMFASYVAEEAGLNVDDDIAEALTRSPLEAFDAVMSQISRMVSHHV